MRVYRIQDKDGRGPWKPGFSQHWVGECDEERLALLPPIQEEFPGREFRVPGMHVGVGCLSQAHLREWIRSDEYQRLFQLGYRAVSFTVDRVLAEGKFQVVFARKCPLRKKVRRFNLWPCAS